MMITQMEFDSDPSALAGIMEAYTEKRANLPAALDSINDNSYYDVPEYLPAGDYSITAKIHYSGGGLYTYNAKIRVEGGTLSSILGILMGILPKWIVKPVVGLVL
jgi:hypothetical protein